MKELFGLKDAEGKKYKLLVESYRDGFTISGILPEQETPKFKIGDWVVWFGGKPTIGRIKKHCLEFGDSWELTDMSKDSKGEYNSCSEVYLRLATSEEIKKHISKICFEKYVGKKIKGIEDGVISTIVAENYKDGISHSWVYSFIDDCFSASSPCVEWEKHSNPIIYKKGVWAEVLPDKKKLPKTKDEVVSMLSDFCTSCNVFDWKGDITWFMKQYED